MQEVSTETINAEPGTAELRQAFEDFARGLRAHLAFEECIVFRLAKAEESSISGIRMERLREYARGVSEKPKAE
jgi:uncharacterized protein with PIN domain